MSSNAVSGIDGDIPLWDFANVPEFSLPDGKGVGRMVQTHFPCGLILYRSEFRVDATCVLDTQGSSDELPHLFCSQGLLTGQTFMQTPDGRTHVNSTESALLFRVKHSGTRIIFPGGQVVRHVGVAGRFDDLACRFGGKLPEALACFENMRVKEAIVRHAPINNRLRKLLAGIYSNHIATSATVDLMLEGMAMMIYSELISALVDSNPENNQTGERPIRYLFQDLSAHIARHLDKPLRAEDLMQKFSISKYALNKLFQAETGCSLREYVRMERFRKARELIEQEGMPVKQAAHQVGYNHVSNFTHAYRQFFGETPGYTQRVSK